VIRFYWSINLGSLIAFSAVAYICQNGIEGLGGLDWSFFVGFSVPAISMSKSCISCLSLFLFCVCCYTMSMYYSTDKVLNCG
jgi:dipeptide/tripeptide permease